MKTSLKPGMTLQGRYRILSLIGKGGMGFVYKVLGLRLNKEFALKEMYDHFVDPGDKERVIKQFQNEAETMARLEHFGIPRIVDTFEENERHYLVMEYVDGKTLEQVVMDNPQYMMENQVIEWTEQILDILDYLHNRPDPIIIRDLKPANIMLGNDGKIHIIDFGIAKIFDPKDRTQTAIKGSGSAGFAPPEQYGSGGTDPRSDIYALGVTLYYLLTKVIIADSVDRILQGGDVLPPSHYNPIVSEAVDALIQKMVELKPDDRFQNVAEIRDYMESANLMISAVQPSAMKPSASSLPKTAVKMQNQEVVEEWKKRQSQVSLTQAPKTAQMPQVSQAAPVPPAAGEREYHFVSEAMLKGKSDEKSAEKGKKKSGIPTFLITGMFVGVFIFLLLCISIPYFLKAGTRQAAVNPSPSPSPSPTVVKVVEEHKTVAGKITKLEKSEDTVKIQVKTSDGPLSLTMTRSKYPKKAKIGAEVKGEYKTKGEGVTKAPWPVISLTVTKSAPAPKPAYVPPAGGGGYGGGYSGGGGGYGGGGGGYGGGGGGGSSGGGGGYSGGGGGGSGGGSSGGGGGGSSGGSGGLTHGRQNY